MPFPRRQDITPATLSLTTLLSKTFQRFLPTPWALSWVTRRSLCHKLKLALLQGSQLKFYILQMEQKASKFEKSSKKMHFQQKKLQNICKSSDLRETRRPRWFFYQCKPPKVACVCRVSLGWNQAAPLACYKCPLHWSCTGFHLLRLSMDTNGYPSETYKNN